MYIYIYIYIYVYMYTTIGKKIITFRVIEIGPIYFNPPPFTTFPPFPPPHPPPPPPPSPPLPFLSPFPPPILLLLSSTSPLVVFPPPFPSSSAPPLSSSIRPAFSFFSPVHAFLAFLNMGSVSVFAMCSISEFRILFFQIEACF